MQKLIVAFIVVLACVSMSQAAVLFQENWNSGINTSVWNEVWVNNEGPKTVEIAPGDQALYLQGNIQVNDRIASKAGFDRSLQPVVTFKYWHTIEAPALNNYMYVGVGGPWVQYNTNQGLSGENFSIVEAGIGQISSVGGSAGNFPPMPDYYFPFWNEDQTVVGNHTLLTGPAGATTPTTYAFIDAMMNAVNKATAVQMRLELGAVTGAKFDFSTDGGTTWTNLMNTIGMPAGQVYSGDFEVAGDSVSSMAAPFLGFGYQGGYFIGKNPDYFNNYSVVDDIVVTGIPEPATMGLLALGGLMLRRRK